MDAAFCAISVFEGVSGGMNLGRLNRLTGKMVYRRKGGKKKKSQKPRLNLVIAGSLVINQLEEAPVADAGWEGIQKKRR